MAARARAVRRVEGEDARRELGQRHAVLRAREALGEDQRRLLGLALAGHDLDLDEAVRHRERGLDRVRQPPAQVVLHHQAIDDHRDVVLELLVQRDGLLEQPHLAVDARPREALAAQRLEHVLELALLAARDRRVDREARPLRQLHDLLDDLLGRLARDRPAADRAVRVPDAREEQAQVVVHLGDGADGRARVAGGRLLVDGDGRRQALDAVDVGLLHLPEELPRVGRERLDVAALALGVERVERQARLARPRQPRDRHELVPRHADRDVLEVVLPGPADGDPAAGQRRSRLPTASDEHQFGTRSVRTPATRHTARMRP